MSERLEVPLPGFLGSSDFASTIIKFCTRLPVVPGSRQSRVEQMKIPLNLPLQRETFYSPFSKGGKGDFWTNVSCESNSVR